MTVSFPLSGPPPRPIRVAHPNGSAVLLPPATRATTTPWICASFAGLPPSLALSPGSPLLDAVETIAERRGRPSLYECADGVWRTGRPETWQEEADRLAHERLAFRAPDVAVVLATGAGGRFCAVARREPAGEYGLPGGGIWPGELAREAAAREAAEEAGLVIVRHHLVEIYEGFGADGVLVRAYFAVAWKHDPAVQTETLHLTWFTREELAARAGRFGLYLDEAFTALNGTGLLL